MTRRLTWLLPVVIVCLAACANETESAEPEVGAPPPGPVGKGDVTREDLVGSHRARATGAVRATFLWDFTETDFTIARDGAGPIPADVLETVAHAQGDVTRIDGKWALTGGALALTELRVVRGDGAGDQRAPDVTLAPFRTPVVRFELGGTQYVLGPR